MTLCPCARPLKQICPRSHAHFQDFLPMMSCKLGNRVDKGLHAVSVFLDKLKPLPRTLRDFFDNPWIHAGRLFPILSYGLITVQTHRRPPPQRFEIRTNPAGPSSRASGGVTTLRVRSTTTWPG